MIISLFSFHRILQDIANENKAALSEAFLSVKVFNRDPRLYEKDADPEVKLNNEVLSHYLDAGQIEASDLHMLIKA